MKVLKLPNNKILKRTDQLCISTPTQSLFTEVVALLKSGGFTANSELNKAWPANKEETLLYINFFDSTGHVIFGGTPRKPNKINIPNITAEVFIGLNTDYLSNNLDILDKLIQEKENEI